jgi:hypothetical protein
MRLGGSFRRIRKVLRERELDLRTGARARTEDRDSKDENLRSRAVARSSEKTKD